LLYVTNTQACQQKTEKFFVMEEKSFIGLATVETIHKKEFHLEKGNVALKFFLAGLFFN